MAFRIVNFLAFQIGWFASVLGAGYGLWWVGPVVVALVIAAQAPWLRRRRATLVLLVASALLGYALDSALALMGWIRFTGEAAVGAPAALWMVMMWPNFAIMLEGALDWLRGRYALGAALGLIGGPLAYYGGAQLGGVALGEPAPIAPSSGRSPPPCCC